MKRAKRYMALGCCALLVTASLCGCAQKSRTISGVEDLQKLQSVVEDFAGTDIIRHSSTAGKEETVYVLLDADGKPLETIVSEWLKNPEGSEELADVSLLENISVVKGNAVYKETEDDHVVWTTGGNDVYYQGTTEKELPVTVSVQYELDGKAVEASELEGASGHLKLQFAYKNNTAKEVVVDGEKTTIYQPFVMLSGLLLDNEKAANVEVENGSAINNGDNTIVFGLAMPGLKESLGINELENEDGEPVDINIPEKVVIEADVTDFSLLMTLTIASNNALSRLGLDDIQSIEDLKADMEELTNGMDDIIDGAVKLNDGVGEMSDGTDKLSDGVGRLSDGTGELADGAHKLSDGANAVNDGATALRDGLETLQAGTPALVSGIDDLSAGAKDLDAGMQLLISNNTDLKQGATALMEGLEGLQASLKDEAAQAQLGALVKGASDFQAGLSGAAVGMNQIVAGYDYTEGDIAALLGGLSSYAETLEGTGDPYSMTMAGCISSLIGAYTGLYDSVEEASMGVASLDKAYEGIGGGIGALSGNMETISEAVEQLTEGAENLQEGVVEYADGAAEAADGAKALKVGITTLKGKVPELVEGIDELVAGAGELADGTGELSDGAGDLSDGADELNDGTAELRTGVSDLIDGVGKLLDGSGELKDGVVKFNDEGISRLAELVNQDLEKYYDRICAVRDYAKEYNGFAGCSDGVECSVKFIYKTDSIGY